MLLLLATACVGGGDSGDKLEDTFPFDTSSDSDTNTDSNDSSETGETGDPPPVTDEYGCPTWFGLKPDRVWTYWPRSASTDTVFDFSAWISDLDTTNGTFSWWYARELTIDGYNEAWLTRYDMHCDPEVGLTRIGGSIELEINDYGTLSSTASTFTYDPEYLQMPVDFGERSRWTVDVVIDQTVDGVNEVVENNLSYAADLLESVELPYGMMDAIAVRLTDVASGNTVGTEYYSDTIGMVADDFSEMANYTP